MSRITLQNLWNTLEDTRATLLDAGGKDGMVSRKDFRALIDRQDSEAHKSFLQFFYTFVRQLEDRPNMRVTAEVIERAITFIEEQIIPNFEIAEQFSNQTNQTIAQIHDAAYPMAQNLIRITKENKKLTTFEVAEEISLFTESLFFDDFGSESSEPIEAFYLEANIVELTPESFAKALELDPNNPSDKIERFADAQEPLMNFVDQHFHFGLADKAQAIVDLMGNFLTQKKVIILGEDYNPDVPPEHPVFVIGVGKDGNIAGFKSSVIWT